MIVSATVLSPCKDCKERQQHCHSKCEKYKAYKEQLELNRIQVKKDSEMYLFSKELKAKIVKRYNQRREGDK